MGETQKTPHKKLYLQVYDDICKYIASNNLKPGDHLPTEMEMCQKLGVSRTILREAIKSLEITGVIRSRPGIGIIIQSFSTDRFFSCLIDSMYISGDDHLEDDVEQMRKVIELGFSAQAFDTLSQEDISKIESILNDMKHAAEVQIRSKSKIFGLSFAEADARFHQTIFSKIPNKLVLSIINFFWAYDRKFKIKQPSSRHLRITLDKHEKIYNALMEHDKKMFMEAMEYHYSYDYKEKS
ncbi:FadR/GntR family transcriptional regulator [Porcincola intestinalis]|jgi:GntR family transcriptional repressor for pyruvate dehydrogenase complex|uniref:FadR family transcriptional regulator n=1 Tax=Porcincola intestinalis TaxID=2606632 RepID=A0A6L5X954_9FIRM|nr:FadR/GntR family transcriptional regulator [Porcincola intestinalis]MSS15244.1 FadR family transcriptional regulator [Porcincola intestinalis]